MKDCFDKKYILNCLQKRDKLYKSHLKNYLSSEFAKTKFLLNDLDDKFLELLESLRRVFDFYKNDKNFTDILDFALFLSSIHRTGVISTTPIIENIISSKPKLQQGIYLKDVIFAILTIVLSVELMENSLNYKNTVKKIKENNKTIIIHDEEFVNAIKNIVVISSNINYINEKDRIDTVLQVGYKTAENKMRKTSSDGAKKSHEKSIVLKLYVKEQYFDILKQNKEVKRLKIADKIIARIAKSSDFGKYYNDDGLIVLKRNMV